jgi:hypothetical protein
MSEGDRMMSEPVNIGFSTGYLAEKHLGGEADGVYTTTTRLDRL